MLLKYGNGQTSQSQCVALSVLSYKTLLLYNQSNMVSAISTLIGKVLKKYDKWSRTLAAPNGYLYGLPKCFRRVVKFNPIDKSITIIGPDLGLGWKWLRGAMTDSGVIYCPPYLSNNRHILKIDTNTDMVTVLNANLLLLEEDWVLGLSIRMWESCALALNGCIYCMPADGCRILKLDPNNGDPIISNVGHDLGRGINKYKGTVVGIDGCVYGIPYKSKRILKYDPINNITSFVRNLNIALFVGNLKCSGNGVLGRDGCIYALDKYGGVLKIDTTHNSHCFVGNTVESSHRGTGWSDGTLGIDGCIYWPPSNATHILKYDPHSNRTSLVGDDLGHGKLKWSGVCTVPDGIIYCLPGRASRILAIDPLKEYTLSLKNNMEEHPENFGCLFTLAMTFPMTRTLIGKSKTLAIRKHRNSSDRIPKDTNFDRAVTKFGQKKVLELLDECMCPIDRVCTVSNFHPFMIAASCKNSRVCVIYHLLRQMPSFANCTIRFSNV